MTDGPKAPKRARVDEPDVRQIVKCDDLYFVDGNIILRAYCADKRAHSLFRVHKSLLALNCLFFRDLFGDSSDSSNLFDASSDKYDGLPVMDMQDDPQDVESFLRALYIPGFMRSHLDPKMHTYDFPRMYAGVMRLVKKFDAPQLHAVFAAELRAYWPSDFREAEARSKLGTARFENAKGDWQEKRRYSHPDAGHALRMAVDNEIFDVLPPLFYELALGFGVGSHVEGREDCCGDLGALNVREMRTLLLGSAALRSHISASFPLDFAEVTLAEHRSFDDCSANPPCRDGDLGPLWKDLSEHMRDGEDPWTVLQEYGMFDDFILCALCRDSVETYLREYREELWRRLPELFKLYGVSAHWPSSA